MALPNGQFNQKEDGAGSATALPTMTINGMEYPVVLVAQQSGHIRGSLDTWTAYADNVAPAANKQMISLFNGASSGCTLRVRKLFLVDLALVAVTGVAVRVDVKRITALSSGTTVTPVAADSQNAALPAAVTCKTGGTATEGALMFPITFATDEVGATQAFPSNLLMQATNWLPEGLEIEECVLREGEGITVKMTTSTTVGSLGFILVFTRE